MKDVYEMKNLKSLRFTENKDLQKGKLYKLFYIWNHTSTVHEHVVMLLNISSTLTAVRVLDGKEIYVLDTGNFQFMEIQ